MPKHDQRLFAVLQWEVIADSPLRTQEGALEKDCKVMLFFFNITILEEVRHI